MLHIRRAHKDEAPALSQLAKKSKAHWGYDAKLMALWESEGAFSIDPADCTAGLVGVIEDDDRVLGFYCLGGQAPIGELSDLWVEPGNIGRGLGRKLLDAARTQANELGFQELHIHSDPNAEDFYVKMGAKRIGQTPAHPLTGRQLPLLSLVIR